MYHIHKSPCKEKFSLKLRQTPWQNMQSSQTHEFLYFTPSFTNLHLASGGISCALGEEKYMHNYKLIESPESCLASRKNNPINPRPGKVSSWSIKTGGLLSWHLNISLRHGVTSSLNSCKERFTSRRGNHLIIIQPDVKTAAVQCREAVGQMGIDQNTVL